MKFNPYQIYQIVAATLVSVGGAFLFLNGESGSLQELFYSSESLQYSLLAIGGWTVESDPWSSRYNVGVKVTSPSYVLQVSGQIYSDSTVYAGSTYGFQCVGGKYWTWRQSGNSLQLYQGAGGAIRWTVLEDGELGLGTATPSYALEVSGTFYSSGSSMDYKQEVQDYKPDADAIMNLRPVNYEYTDEYKHFGKRLENNSPQIGLVAEEVAEVMPELAVMKKEDGKDVVRNVDYEKLTVVLLSELQNMKKEIEVLKNGN
jgi:hypothetical protein